MNTITLTDHPFSDLSDGMFEDLTIPARLTEDEFVIWTTQHEKVRVEWVNGEVILMSPVSARHVEVCGWLYSVLRFYVEEKDLGKVIGSDFVFRIDQQQLHSRREPDVMFLQKSRLDLIKKNHLEGPPDVAIEIVSPESVKRDWNDKLAEYETSGVQEYWIIDPQTDRFEAFKLDSQGKFVSIYNQSSGVFKSQAINGFEFPIEWLWMDELPTIKSVMQSLGLI